MSVNAGIPVRNDYDSPWKEILEAYFEECMAFFFPNVHADIDWGKGYEFLDKELQQIVREAEVGKRVADKLVLQPRRCYSASAIYRLAASATDRAGSRPLARYTDLSGGNQDALRN